jgi:hypothetical protein
MKKIIVLFAVLAMAALASCGGSVSVTQNGGGAQSGTNAPSGTGTGNVTNPTTVVPAG